MSAVVGTPTPQILQNRGVPVKFYSIEQAEGGRWVRKYDDLGEAITEVKYLQMTNAVLSDIEDEVVGWGGMEGWQNALQSQPFRTLGKSMALLLGYWLPANGDGVSLPDIRRAGQAMIDGETSAYQVALLASFMLANGAPGDRVGKQLAEQLSAAGKQAEKMWAEAFEESKEPGGVNATPTLPNADTPSLPGSETGSSSDETPTSSGD